MIISYLSSYFSFSFSGFIDFDDESSGVNVILLVFIVIGILIGTLIFVGVIYNCFKRHKQGRHIFSGKHMKESISFKEVDQSDDESDYEAKSSKDRRGSADSTDSLKPTAPINEAKETKVDINMKKDEENGLLKENGSNSNTSSPTESEKDAKNAESELKHIDED